MPLLHDLHSQVISNARALCLLQAVVYVASVGFSFEVRRRSF